MLRVKKLEAGYGPLKVLRKVSLHIGPGEVVTVIGANGAGKTTLLKTLSGLLSARGGEILFEKKDIRRLPAERIVFLGCSLGPGGRRRVRPPDRAGDPDPRSQRPVSEKKARGGQGGPGAGLRPLPPPEGTGDAAGRYPLRGGAADAGYRAGAPFPAPDAFSRRAPHGAGPPDGLGGV